MKETRDMHNLAVGLSEQAMKAGRTPWREIYTQIQSGSNATYQPGKWAWFFYTSI
jgi:hypothetical protein